MHNDFPCMNGGPARRLAVQMTDVSCMIYDALQPVILWQNHACSQHIQARCTVAEPRPRPSGSATTISPVVYLSCIYLPTHTEFLPADQAQPYSPSTANSQAREHWSCFEDPSRPRYAFHDGQECDWAGVGDTPSSRPSDVDCTLTIGIALESCSRWTAGSSEIERQRQEEGFRVGAGSGCVGGGEV